MPSTRCVMYDIRRLAETEKLQLFQNALASWKICASMTPILWNN